MKVPQVPESATSGILLKPKTSVSSGGFKLPLRNILKVLGASKKYPRIASVKLENTKKGKSLSTHPPLSNCGVACGTFMCASGGRWIGWML